MSQNRGNYLKLATIAEFVASVQQCELDGTMYTCHTVRQEFNPDVEAFHGVLSNGNLYISDEIPFEYVASTLRILVHAEKNKEEAGAHASALVDELKRCNQDDQAEFAQYYFNYLNEEIWSVAHNTTPTKERCLCLGKLMYATARLQNWCEAVDIELESGGAELELEEETPS